jgi:hypothetical protein
MDLTEVRLADDAASPDGRRRLRIAVPDLRRLPRNGAARRPDRGGGVQRQSERQHHDRLGSLMSLSFFA